MKDERKTKSQLIDELTELRRRLAGHDKAMAELGRARDVCRDCDERFRTIADYIYNWEYWRGPDNSFIYISPSCEKISGYPPEDFLDDPEMLEKIIYPDDKAQVVARMREALENEEELSIDFRIICLGGEERWISHFSRPVYNDKGDCLGRRGSNRDTTDWKVSEELLRESEERYRRIFKNIQDVYYESSLGGLILEISPSIEYISKFKRSELIGMSLYDVFFGQKQINDFMMEIREKTKLTDYEITLRDKDGSQKACSINAMLVVNKEGKHLKIVGSIRDISDRKRAQEEIRQLAYYDTLTGLPNRFLFHDRLAQALSQANRSGQIFSLLFLDLDRFKDVNDTLGHASGDLLLIGAAERLKSCVRDSDTVARLGGDEFVILLPSVKKEQGVNIVAEKILKLMAKPFELDGHEVFISTSIGIVLYPLDGLDAEILLKHADLAMYAAKDRGRNTYQFYSENINAKVEERREMENNLRRAYQRREFFLEYQPQVDSRTGKINSIEALLRWQHPEKGVVSPVEFISIAEEIGIIRDLGEWVFRCACAQNKAWQIAGYPSLRMAVNLSAHQFKQPDLMEMVCQVLKETQLDPSCLELELTERVLMEDAEATTRTLKALKKLGIQLAIDDFGTGYSSLNYLKNFPIDRIKIDQSFVREITSSPDGAAIVQAIIAMSQSLNMKVIAEGVETKEQVDALKKRGCYEMQGYYFGRPAPPENFICILNQKSPL